MRDISPEGRMLFAFFFLRYIESLKVHSVMFDKENNCLGLRVVCKERNENKIVFECGV